MPKPKKESSKKKKLSPRKVREPKHERRLPPVASTARIEVQRWENEGGRVVPPERQRS